MTQPVAPARDAEDSPGSVSSKQPLSIHREERRFLVDSGQSQRQALKDRGIPRLRNYIVRTLYMEPGDEETWSIGKSQVKFRLRQYNDEKIWWFERKTNVAGMVNKDRVQVTDKELDKLDMRPIVVVEYVREEFETGGDALDEYQEGKTSRLTQWLRVTIDTGVTAIQVPQEMRASEAMRNVGRTLATLKNRVLEVKSGQNEVPLWLPLPMEWKGSKSRFGVAARYGPGGANMWAPAYTPGSPAWSAT